MNRVKQVKFINSVKVGPSEHVFIDTNTKKVRVVRDGGLLVLSEGDAVAKSPLSNVCWFTEEETPQPEKTEADQSDKPKKAKALVNEKKD